MTPDPAPRASPSDSPPIPWPVAGALACRPIRRPVDIPFPDIFEGRRTARQLSPPTLADVLDVIGFATRARFVSDHDTLRRTRRPSLSAGALHPIEVVLAPLWGAPRLFRLDAEGQRLQRLRVARPGALARHRGACGEAAPEAQGMSLGFVADATRTEAAYEHAQSLIWRDAGALLQTVALSAEAYGLRIRPLGFLGDDLVQALGLEGQLTACGIAILGAS